MKGRFVSGCSSYTSSRQKLEFEIQTHPDFRRRGLATAATSAMILHCIDRGLEPCWAAHNQVSAAAGIIAAGPASRIAKTPPPS